VAADERVGDEGVVAAGLTVAARDTGDVALGSPLRVEETGHGDIIIKVGSEA
jgi:hypothetical protein